ncbi:MAG: endolytic transglycosylase MltG [Candidatus Cloacimonetes bacterium]|nr:endolytic transglycosylase MltG [Candidatus Cloacimonadota bacterium]
MKLYLKITSVIGILLVVTVLLLAVHALIPRKLNEVIIDIPRGASARAIAAQLYDNNIIPNKLTFYFYVKLTNIEKELSYGKYLFSGKQSIPDIIRTLHEGNVVLRKATIPEGLTIRKTAKLLSQKGFIDYEKFVALSNDSIFVKKLTGFSIPSLEGFLFPETYHLPYEASEQYIIKALVENFFKQTQDLDFAPTNNLNFYEIIILASIVEKEAKFKEELGTIASVYLNRIKYDYKLQADPTIAYALEQKGKIRRKIYYRDLKIESPYNTYMYMGLPPTPICSPSASAIQAVLNPEETDFFFFFANGNGYHEFNQTYQQHINQQNSLRK